MSEPCGVALINLLIIRLVSHDAIQELNHKALAVVLH